MDDVEQEHAREAPIEELPEHLAPRLLTERIMLHDAREEWKRELGRYPDAAALRGLAAAIRGARFSPLGDNHHSASACPYCNPRGAQ